MSSQVTLAQVEQQIAQLPLHEQLKLISHIAEQLSTLPPGMPRRIGEEDTLQQQRAREVDELLALCDAAAEMWEGEFDAADEIRQMRQERDEQICLSKS